MMDKYKIMSSLESHLRIAESQEGKVMTFVYDVMERLLNEY